LFCTVICYNRLTVDEVLAQLEDEEFWQADIYITPPNNGTATDEDSADEDGGTVNNLSGKQLDSSAVATVRIGGERMLLGKVSENQLDADNDEQEVEIESDEDQPTEHRVGAENLKRRRTTVIDKPGKKVAKVVETPPTDVHTAPSKRASVTQDEVFSLPRRWMKKDLKATDAGTEWKGEVPKFLKEDWSPLIYSSCCLTVT
jgi:hypothetical protein